jgi:hypothetical protein
MRALNCAMFLHMECGDESFRRFVRSSSETLKLFTESSAYYYQLTNISGARVDVIKRLHGDAAALVFSTYGPDYFVALVEKVFETLDFILNDKNPAGRIGLEQNAINLNRVFCSRFSLVASLNAKTVAHFLLDALIGDTVISRSCFGARSSTTGKLHVAPHAEFPTVRNGKICAIDVLYWDRAAIAAATKGTE